MSNHTEAALIHKLLSLLIKVHQFHSLRTNVNSFHFIPKIYSNVRQTRQKVVITWFRIITDCPIQKFVKTKNDIISVVVAELLLNPA